VSTAEAHRWYDAAAPAGGRAAVARLDGSWTLGLGPIRNDLEGPVAARHPEIEAARAALLAAGARAAGLSGSGSAVFGLFEGREAAERAMAQVDPGGLRFPWAHLTRTRPRGGPSGLPGSG